MRRNSEYLNSFFKFFLNIGRVAAIVSHPSTSELDAKEAGRKRGERRKQLTLTRRRERRQRSGVVGVVAKKEGALPSSSSLAEPPSLAR